jgi:hypothetical protein
MSASLDSSQKADGRVSASTCHSVAWMLAFDGDDHRPLLRVTASALPQAKPAVAGWGTTWVGMAGTVSGVLDLKAMAPPNEAGLPSGLAPLMPCRRLRSSRP